ncbi:TIGR03013 family PEP-CTERM/XrtA system glycosyltransferase [Corallincola holothuriorum]|uniref:TIGR03013 family PEP-CTERM/XrtA system glycosyltransferase n=1 Tax=Corallincola holothuriorum TaxID=2282215 RepID=A0A368N3T9_9GAMM|nr:TIGR03013 family XrtA/PEP-CTERM system glycosyltransferase [Corallincola holothuriorum]RCU45148.1 TIGR03013 family PEP-CTERM/XrtA system glycosyltransferase [Corallincola holothuriorum]
MTPDLKSGGHGVFVLVVVESFLLLVALHLCVLAEPWLVTLHSQNSATIGNASAAEFITFAVIGMLSLFAMGLYNPRLREHSRGVLRRIGLAMILTFGLLAALSTVFPALTPSPSRFLSATLLAIGLLGLFRMLSPKIPGLGAFRRRILVLGAGQRASIIEKRMRRKVDRRNFFVCGYIPMQGDKENEISDQLYVDSKTPLVEYIAKHNIDEIIVACDERRQQLPVRELFECKLRGVEITDILSFIERETGQIAVNLIYPSWMIYSNGFKPADNLRSQLDWILNTSLALLLVFFCWPLMIGTALAIWLEDGRRGGSILYRQERIGLGGHPFNIIKFRSMRSDAETNGAQWAKKDDDRVTKVGEIIRKYRLDELPQLINVLKGEMGFVGPRPERPEFVDKLAEKLPYYSERHSVKPGLTGWAQLCYPYGASEEDALEKLKYDLYYVKHRSFLLDIFIFIQTVEVVLFKKGAR